MNSLQPFQLKDTPTHLISASDEQGIYQEINDALSGPPNQSSWANPAMCRRLVHRPEVFANLISLCPTEVPVLVSAVKTPSEAMNIVCAKPEMFCHFTEMLLSSNDTLEQLFWFNHFTTDQQLPIDSSVILERLVDEPLRCLRILAALDSSEFDDYDAVVSQEVAGKRVVAPGWLLAWIDRESGTVSLTEGDIDVLARDEFCLFQAIRLLRGKLQSIESWAPLVKRIQNPRWAYHVLKQGLAGEYAAHCKAVLRQDPAWLVESWVDFRSEWKDIQEDYTLCSAECGQHELLPELHKWFAAATLAWAKRESQRRGALSPKSE